MNGFVTSCNISEKWGVSERYVQLLCKDGRVVGAVKFGNTWAIPENAEKPTSKKGKDTISDT